MADNRKGGYQIIDLSGVTVGTQATISGIYDKVGGNNKKPIMIITPDGQRVFAEVKAGTNKYVTAYLGADGATYTVEISKANKVDITQQPSDATTSAKVDAIDERISKNKINSTATDSWVQITSYDGSTADKFFVCPNDGYIHATAGTANTNGIEIAFSHSKSTTGSVSMLAVYGTGASRNSTASTFVRKGQIVYVSNASGTYDAHFAPLV